MLPKKVLLFFLTWQSHQLLFLSFPSLHNLFFFRIPGECAGITRIPEKLSQNIVQTREYVFVFLLIHLKESVILPKSGRVTFCLKNVFFIYFNIN